MDEVQPEEGMAAVLDAAIHMNAAALAGMPLNGGGGIHDRKFVRVRRDADIIARHHRDLREQGAFGLPALRAAAGMIVSDLPLDRHLNGVLVAMEGKRPAREIRRAGFYTLIDGRVDLDRACHLRLPRWFFRFAIIDSTLPSGTARGCEDARVRAGVQHGISITVIIPHFPDGRPICPA